MNESDDLRERIEAARNAGKPKQNPRDLNSNAGGAAAALGHAAAMVVAVAIGAFIGVAIDKSLGTGPWALLIFLVFGMAAGFLNIIRAANQMAERAQRDQAARDAPEEGE